MPRVFVRFRIDEMDLWKEKFINELFNSEDCKSYKYFVMNRGMYKDLLEEIKEAKSAAKKTSLQYRRVNRFDVLNLDGVERIIAKSKGGEVLYYLPVEEIFDVIQEAHVAIGHGGRDRLKVETSRKYANITTRMISLYLTMCDVCNSRKAKKAPKRELNCQCQVDVIDMQSQPDGEFKFILVYQEHLTKFLLLRALTRGGDIDDSNENSWASADQNASLEPKTELEVQQPIAIVKTNDQDDGESPDGAGFHFLTHEYLSEKVTQDSINEIIDSLPKARSDLLEYLVKGDGTVVCKWCGEVLPSRTHWYRHKYKLHVPPTGLPAGLIKCIKCNTFFKSRKGYVGHCVARHGSVEEAEKEEDEEHVIIKEEKVEVFEETNVEEVLENIEKEEKIRRNDKLVDNFGRGRKRNQIKDERKEDYIKQREKEEKLVAEIIAKVKKECEDQSITMCRRGYSRRSTVMTSFREYDKRK